MSQIVSKLQKDLLEIIQNNYDTNEYELLVYKYVFSNELNILLSYDEPFLEINEDSFDLYVIPDNLSLNHLRLIDDLFDKFELTLQTDERPNILKIKFEVI